MRNLLRNLGLTAALLIPAMALAAENLTAKVDGVAVLMQPKMGSKTVAELKAGDELQGLERRGLFWKVKTADGKSGFVMITKVASGNTAVSAQLSGAMRSILKSKKDETASSGRVRTQDAVMGIRGLSNDDLSGVGALRPNLEALAQLESFTVPDRDIEALQSAVLTEADSLNQ